MTLTLWAKCDYPPVQEVFKISSTATVGELKKEAVSALSALAGLDLARYVFYFANYKNDVVGLDKKGLEEDTLSEVGLKDRGIVFIRAPADVKPALKGLNKKKKPEKEDSGDRYAGYTPATAFQKLKTAKGNHKAIALEYIDIYFKKILATGKFQKCPEPLVAQLVKRDTLNIREIELFEAVLAWAKEECKRRELEDKPDNLKLVLANILPFIRFPVMTTEELAVTVTSTGLLTPEQTLLLFTYLGQKAEGGEAKLPEGVKFPIAKRKGRLPPAWFKFEEAMKYPQLVLTGDGTMLTSTTTSYYQPAFGNIELKEGVHEWEFHLQQLYNNSYSCCIGVVPATFTEYTTRAQMIGYPSHIPGWAFAAGYGQKFHSTQTSYGRTCTEGDVVKVRLDLDKTSIEFFINGTSQGVAYTDVTGPVRPAISLYGNTTAVLRFPK